MSQNEAIQHILAIFPDLDQETITSVLAANKNNVERSVNYLLGIEDPGGAAAGGGDFGGGFGGGDFGGGYGGDFGGGYGGQNYRNPPKAERRQTVQELYQRARMDFKEDPSSSVKAFSAVLEEEVLSKRSIWGLKSVKWLISYTSEKKKEQDTKDYLNLVLVDYMAFLEGHGRMLSQIFIYITSYFNIVQQQNFYLMAYDKVSLPALFPFLRQCAIMTGSDLEAPKVNWAATVHSLILAAPEITLGAFEIQTKSVGLFRLGFTDIQWTGRFCSPANIILLANGIKASTTLQTIVMTEETKIDLRCGKLLADALIGHPSLVQLRLQDTSIMFDGGALIMAALATAPNMKNLSLDYGKLSSKTLIAIPPQLQHLDLSNNNLGQAGARQLSKIVKKSAALLSLSVAGDLTVGTDGALLIVGALKKNQTLTFLNISYTESDDSVMLAIMEVADRPEFVVEAGGNSLSKDMVLKCKNHPKIRFLGLDKK